MARGKSFEDNLKEIDNLINEIENNENLSLDESIKKYEKAMKLIQNCSQILEKSEGKVLKIKEENGKLIFSEFKKGE
ncbi:exodeoxyribonuclease VII small subunit [Hypnocyclicus thermotrophus]|uniref:Exodeoxyribonuclease 7 small subunit n=1 Tax=Hypnocyclicus thermotrophus TaxID=1627895 RepID=A0AA46DXH8_9FUSO|nr:exodeoxyribonuclease VII small subunit [Hypnocyclicus thermotrophus]TDT68052.1 exodeoxyribonuclease VII small subunit [Hypnocyclicus thermotrophus]